MGAGLFLTRHPGLLRRTFGVAAAYVPRYAEGLDVVDPYTSSIQWSRRFIGLKIFLSLAAAGWDGYGEAIGHQVRMGARLRRRLRESGWAVVNDTPLPVVCFVDSARPAGRTQAYLEAVSRRVVAGGRAWLSTTVLGGSTPVLRACVSNFGTAPADVDALVAELAAARMRRAARLRLAGASRPSPKRAVPGLCPGALSRLLASGTTMSPGRTVPTGEAPGRRVARSVRKRSLRKRRSGSGRSEKRRPSMAAGMPARWAGASRRTVMRTIPLGLLAGPLAACAGGSAGGADTPASQGAAAGAGGATPGTTKPAQEVRLGTWASASLLEVIKSQVADFEQRANGAVRLKLEVAPWQQYWDKMQVQVAGGTTPDVVWMSGATFLDLNAKGAFKELSAMAKADKGLNLADQWNEPLYTDGGKLWAVPYTASVDAMYYNKTMLKEAGIPEPPTDWNDPGWTWDDLRGRQDADRAGQGRAPALGDRALQRHPGRLGPLGAVQRGPRAEQGPHREPDGLARVHRLHPVHRGPDPQGQGLPRPRRPVGGARRGRPGQLHGRPGRFPRGEQLAHPHLPAGEGLRVGRLRAAAAAPGKPRQVTWVQNPYSMSNGTKVPDGAWQFLTYIASKPGQDFMGAAKIIMPSLKGSAFDTSTYLKPPPANTRVFPDAMEKGFVTDLQFTKTWLRYTQVAQEQLDSAYLDERPVADACRAAKREVDKVLKGV